MDTGDKIKVGVVDDHDLMVAGVRALLSTQRSPALFVAGAGTVPALLRTRQEFDVVLLDVRLDDGSHPEDNVRTLTSLGFPVVLHADQAHREAAPILHRSSASGLVWKNESPIELLRAIVTVAHGERRVPPNCVRATNLTHRETEVLKLYASGLKYAETAAALDPPVSVESVKTYLSRIRKRYHEAGRPASTRIELRQRALEDGLLTPEG